MRSLSALELLGVWERGLVQPPVQRALTLLAAAHPELPYETLERLNIGQRDARLLTLREWLFGQQIISVARCPSCGERLEFSFEVSSLRGASEPEAEETFSLSEAGYELSFRLPNSGDLLVMSTVDAPTRNRFLLERCLLTVQHNGKEQPTDQLPASVAQTIVERMAELDPQADVHLALSCPACDYQWQAPFDIVVFFWSEIHAWAKRILQEVHTLASAYGWREADILAMSSWRRQCYLEIIGG